MGFTKKQIDEMWNYYGRTGARVWRARGPGAYSADRRADDEHPAGRCTQRRTPNTNRSSRSSLLTKIPNCRLVSATLPTHRYEEMTRMDRKKSFDTKKR